MSFKIEVVVETRSELGESPHYDPQSNEVIWVDCDGKSINFFDVESKRNRKLQLEKKVAIAIPCKSGNSVLALMEKNICLVNRDTGEVTVLCSVEEERPLNRFNDGKCDSKGRLWYGTLYPAPLSDIFNNKTPPSYGAFYSFDGVTIKQHLSKVELSNGLDWSIDDKCLYHINSMPKKIYSYDYEADSGTISNQREIIDFSTDSSLGYPDGMCRDSEGKLWVAGVCGSNISRWDPETGERLLKIDMPVVHPTACCFGGSDYSTLYVTSGTFGSSDEEIKKFPLSGSLFAITGLGVTGLPANSFDDTKCAAKSSL
ncbi:PREDICTED: regucalcin-like [Amphimedon queenslandica]|nr:PREDICTED: regucalcin-like [Amphimedon queenslandica]|eukprot:XP_003385736.1 PREDICTED: regucalcin-like [Amphimedon queenslandica]